MTAKVIPLRPRSVPVPSARPRSERSLPSSSWPSMQDGVRVTIDDTRGVHVAVCDRCTDNQSAYSDSLAWLLEWADTHRCDRELVSLLASICGQGAA